MNKYIQKSSSVLTFIITELIAIICFGLGGSNVVFFDAGILLNVFSLPFIFKNSTRQELKYFGLFAIPLILVSFLISFGNLYSGSNLFFGNLSSFLAIVSFLMVGYATRRIQGFKIESLVLAIGGGFALVTLISMVITWYNYGVFYSLLYKDTPIYYYNGALFNVTKESAWLLGFSVSEVSLSYSGLFGTICSIYLLGLFFIKYKDTPRQFVIVLLIGIIGLLSLITIPNIKAIIITVVALIFGLGYKFMPRNQKAEKIVNIIIIALFAIILLGLLLVILNTNVASFASFVTNNDFLRKALNTLMKDLNPVFKVAFKSGYLFGIKPTLLNGSIIASNTHMLEVEIVKEGGVFALLFFLVFVVFVTYAIKSYSKKSKDNAFTKTILITLIFAIFVYVSANYDAFPEVHNSSSYNPPFRTVPVLIMLLLIGLTYYPFMKEVPLYFESENFNKTVIDEKLDKKESKDNDYNFDEEDDLDE